MNSRIPQPKVTSDLSKLRWKTKLVRPPVVNLDNTSENSPQDIYIGQTPNHKFFEDSVSTPPLPSIESPIWGYGIKDGTKKDGTESIQITSPGVTLEATENKTVFVNWINKHQPEAHHPFDEPPRELQSPGMCKRYSVGHAVVHLHGAHVPWTSDGYSMRVSQGMNGGTVPTIKTILRPSESEIFEYPNTQFGGATLWYHDHTMDTTAMNVYAGLAGVYLLRHKEEKGLASLPKEEYEIPLVIQDRSFTADGKLLYGDADFLQRYIDDRYNQPQSYREAFVAGTDNQPSPEFKGQVICVNGKIWPYLEVEPRPYRFRIVNGSNSRMYVLRLSNQKSADDPDMDGSPALSIHQIGADGGLLGKSIELNGNLDNSSNPPQPILENFLILAAGERADVIIDFSTLAGKTIYLSNHATESAPFGNGGDDPTKKRDNRDDIYPYTNGILKFHVSLPLVGNPSRLDNAGLERLKQDLQSIPKTPNLNTLIPNLANHKPDRQYLIEEFGPIALTPESLLKITHGGKPRGWKAITFQPDITVETKSTPGYLWGDIAPRYGAVPNGNPRPIQEASPNDKPHRLAKKDEDIELWEFYNNSPDVHPIHLHHSNFQIYSRVRLNYDIKSTVAGSFGLGVSENEKGLKDTVRVNPGELTRILVRFEDRKNRTKDNGDDELTTRPIDYYQGHYVWHCHILEHEDMGMMRPLEVE